MRMKQMLVIFAVIALALPLAAQREMGMQVPTLSGIWRPVVGSGSTYEMTREGNKTLFDFAVLGKEDLGGKTGYWVEMTLTEPKENRDLIIKVLETVDGNTISYLKWVMQMPGQPPMEMNPNMMNMAGGRAQTQAADFRDKAELVGTESITVPAGTFTCEHYRMKDGSGEAWISDKVSPWGMVKMQDKLRTTVLAKVTTDAKDRITGMPTKFDPSQIMRQRMGQQPQ